MKSAVCLSHDSLIPLLLWSSLISFSCFPTVIFKFHYLGLQFLSAGLLLLWRCAANLVDTNQNLGTSVEFLQLNSLSLLAAVHD